MPYTYSRTLIHLIFSTKGREPSIAAEIRQRLHAYIAGVIRESGGEALLIGGTVDHVHILMLLSPMCSVAEIVRVIKTNSSKWLHDVHPEHAEFAWQTGYAVFSVSESNADKVAGYIASQEAHHHKVSFHDEYIGFLRKHGIVFDERYVWD